MRKEDGEMMMMMEETKTPREKAKHKKKNEEKRYIVKINENVTRMFVRSLTHEHSV